MEREIEESTLDLFKRDRRVSPFVKVSISDGRSLTVRLDMAVRKSQLLLRMIAQEGKELDDQLHRIEETMAHQRLGGVLGPESTGNIVLELGAVPEGNRTATSAQLEATKIAPSAQQHIQTYFDLGCNRLPDQFPTIEEALELLIAMSYLEMENEARCYRELLIRTINEASSEDEARRRLKIDSSFVPPSDPAEQQFVSLFRKAWAPGRASRAAAPVAALVAPASAQAAAGHVPGTPDVDDLRSSLGRMPANVVCPCNGNGVPPEITTRRGEMRNRPTNVCTNCGTEFTMFTRPHTCRACGGTFCYSCLGHQVTLGFRPVQTAGSIVFAFREGWWGGSMVCDKCYDIIMSIGSKYSLWSQAMMAATFPLATACRAALLSKEWYECAKDYVFRFRNLQHRLPTKPYTDEEKRIIWTNREQFGGHPLWTLQLLRVADWDSRDARRDVLRVIRKETFKYDCEDLLCSKACNGKSKDNGLRPIDCIVALNGHLFPLPHVIRGALVDILNEASTAELLHYVPHLVHYLRFDQFPFEVFIPQQSQQQQSATASAIIEHEDDCDKSPLTHMLFRRCFPDVWTDESRQLCFELYWALAIEVSAGGIGSDGKLHDFAFVGLYNHLRNALVCELQRTPEGVQLMEAIGAEYALVDRLKDEKNIEKEVPPLIARERLFLPFDSSRVVVSADVANREVKSSAKRPVIIPCRCVPTSEILAERRNARPPVAPAAGGPQPEEPRGERPSFMFKEDDLRNDQVVMKCVQIIKDVVFAEVDGLRDLPCVSYHVQPITKCTGFIEIIAGKTLTDIQRRGTVSEWLLEHVKDGKGRDVFIQSAAVGTVLVYVLGIGDRHRENLMVTDNGEFINIDFGYLEGNDTMYSPYARIPADVICYGENKQAFLNLCKCIYLQLRRYAMHIHSLLLFLHTAEERADLKRCEDFIQSRFCVECDEDEALRKLDSFLVSSECSFMNTVRDVSHQSKQYLVNAMDAIWKLFHREEAPATSSTSLNSTATSIAGSQGGATSTAGSRRAQPLTQSSGVAFPPAASSEFGALNDSMDSVGYDGIDETTTTTTTTTTAAAAGGGGTTDTTTMADTGYVFLPGLSS